MGCFNVNDFRINCVQMRTISVPNLVFVFFLVANTFSRSLYAENYHYGSFRQFFHHFVERVNRA